MDEFPSPYGVWIATINQEPYLQYFHVSVPLRGVDCYT